ncbi:hypothetical protein Phum_PHUM004540 [Pediculus humanus corporis]|uniref:Uncharacterized protein n=1 Tax=Pediculus humanus subsp. corporis TaxID=121224 RepID=E0V966_PEDHC|nr:uncharacterized protein Phum_PHUM004540 [Pediculus humanus corporis]EEB09922.1 hypothetical protein Phum_PHUM004540 [Pediculus humanus corporis]
MDKKIIITRRRLSQYFSTSSGFSNDDISGRSYVDPWDMENYSFLRKQLEDVNNISPGYDSGQNDIYYVPLDTNGSLQYKRFYGGDVVTKEDSNNPSRQSERSRYNNQDYHTYLPPSIIKDISNVYMPTCKLKRRASVSFHPDSYNYLEIDTLPYNNRKYSTEKYIKFNDGKTSGDVVKTKLNRRKSFQDGGGGQWKNDSDFKIVKIERRKSMINTSPYIDKLKPEMTLTTEVIPEQETDETVNFRKSMSNLSVDVPKKPIRKTEKGILLNPDNKCNRVGLNVSFNNEVLLQSSSDSLSRSSSLVYVYENPGKREKMFLPEITTNIYGKNNYRNNRSEIQDGFTMDPIEQCLNNGPTGRYTMTNYGHLKIDYSCSWNYLDQVITQRL